MNDLNQGGASRRRNLATILQSETCTIASSVFDPVSARLAQHFGAECGIMGGSAVAQVVLGAPDIVLLTASDLVEETRRVCRTDSVELIVDADHGYGNALNAMRIVNDLQSAGAAAICLEDSRLPRQYGSSQTMELVSAEEHAHKLKAALTARGNGPALIFGRSNALPLTGIKDTVARLKAYEQVGVDALFIPYLKSRQELDQIASDTTLPLILASADPSLFDLDYLSQRRVKVWMWGHQTLSLATTALAQAMSRAQQGLPPEKANPDYASIVTASEQYSRLAQQFLSP